MRILTAMAFVLLLTAQAQAQMPHINMMPDVATKTPEEREQEAIRDKAYKDSLRKIPDAKASSDPWGAVRSDAPKDASKAAPAPKAKTKTGSNAPRSQ